MSNPFENAEYSFGGWGFGGHEGDPATSTGYYVGRNSLTNRAGSLVAVTCLPGKLVAKSGYKINANPLTSNKIENAEINGVVQDVYVDVIYKASSFYQWEDEKTLPQGTAYACVSVKKDSNADFTQSELATLYGTAFEYIPDEVITITYGAGFDKDGNMIVSQDRRDVQIGALKQQCPDYNDDQLLDKAIGLARALGGSTKIVWDGADIHFTGAITHSCYGFGGIDFNGSKIYLPNYETEDYENIILSVVPDSSTDLTVDASTIFETYTTATALKNKVFCINRNYSGNADMSLGTRPGFDTVIYHTPTIMTDESGDFATAGLYLVPESGDVPCYNVHDYPECTFEICNGTIISNTGEYASYFVACERSNVHIHNFTLKQRSNTQAEHSRAIFQIRYCCGVEVDHIEGTNPFQKNLHGGYFLGLSSVTNAYVHDCYVGDYESWGVIGSNHIINTIFERCYLNRWDCHYAQHGYNTIKNCVLNAIVYGAGHGILSVEDSTFINPSSQFYINARPDNVGVFDGDIVVKRCSFIKGISRNLPANTVIFGETITSETPSNTRVTGEPKKSRVLENCVFPEGISSIFKLGASVNKDKHYFQNLKYAVKYSKIDCAEGIVIPVVSNQTIREVNIDGCVISDCYAVKDITCDLKVSNCELVTIKANSTIPKLIATGNVFSGSQSVSNFTAYALAGNIASDMASVNKHS